MPASKQKFRSPRRYMPGTKLPDPMTQTVEDRLFELQRESFWGRHVRFHLTDDNNTGSGMRGIHIVKLSEDDLFSHGLSFDVYDRDTDTEIPYWEIGMDFESFDFILAFDMSADNGDGEPYSGADVLRLSRAEDDTVSGSRSTKFIMSHRAGSPETFTAFFTVEAGDTLSGINLSVNNSGTGRSAITITQRAANHWGTISFDNALRIGCDLDSDNVVDFFVRDDIAGVNLLVIDESQVSTFIGPVVAKNYAVAVASKTGNYTITSSDGAILADASGGGFTVTLPTAVGITGRTYTVKKTDSSVNAVTVATTGGQTIDGGSTAVIDIPETSLEFRSDGSNWRIV